MGSVLGQTVRYADPDSSGDSEITKPSNTKSKHTMTLREAIWHSVFEQEYAAAVTESAKINFKNGKEKTQWIAMSAAVDATTALESAMHSIWQDKQSGSGLYERDLVGELRYQARVRKEKKSD